MNNTAERAALKLMSPGRKTLPTPTFLKSHVSTCRSGDAVIYYMFILLKVTVTRGAAESIFPNTIGTTWRFPPSRGCNYELPADNFQLLSQNGKRQYGAEQLLQQLTREQIQFSSTQGTLLASGGKWSR